MKETEDLNDLRLGASIKENCQTCFGEWNKCSGHFGHYRFTCMPVIHPLMVSTARKSLKDMNIPYKIKIYQNSLQILKHGEWKVLTFLDIEEHIMDYVAQDESRSVEDLKWLRWAMPISPPCLRPTCYTPERGTSYNDITHRLSSIVRMDKAMQQSIANNSNNTTEHRRYAARLQLSYTLLFFVPKGARESRELSAIADRFKGKEGRLRQSLLGKRITFSARTVITGDPCLRTTELGVPIEVAEKLTKPVWVAAYNFDYVQDLMKRKQIKYVVRSKMRFDPHFRKIHLKVGDICHVKLQDGMRVLFNRQPTLWLSSVQCLYVRRVNRKTFSINCEITPAFNADFDGDEMNMFVPQTIESEGELECLMQSREHLLLGGQGVVQDTALGCYLLSLEDCELSRDTFFHCLYFVLAELDRDKDLKAHFDFDKVCKGPYTGRALLSCLFGEQIHREGCVERGTVVSVLNKGTVKKKLLPLIQKEYGKKELGNFLYLLSRISAECLRRRGFSVGLSSLESWKSTDESFDIEQKTKDFVDKVQTKDEWLLLRLGNLLKSKKAVRTKDIFSENNPMLILGAEKSGAKGSLLNLIQIRSSLGQQYYKGGLIRMFRNGRVLSSEPLHSTDLSKEQQLARRGFIDSNFLKGLNPTECMLHAMTSRLSLLDTALKTSETGYASRRLGKSLEDCIVQYDNTLRNNRRVLFFDVGHFKQRDLEPGHAIGIIASQSIGQRVMQLTLNTFHTAGTACLEVSDGVPRMEALINVWSRKLDQSRLLEIKGINAWTGHQFIRKHGSVLMKDLTMKAIKVVRAKSPPPGCSVYALKATLDEILCKKNRICAWDIEVAIRKSDLYPEILPVSRPTSVTCFFYTDLLKPEAKFALIDRIAPKLCAIDMRPQAVPIKMSWSQNTLQLKGIGLKESFEVFQEHWKRICSTNTVEVLETLGVEACRQTLLRELQKVFNNGVREIYLLTLCEYMCWLGKLCPITRNGILMSNDNVFKNMAFEQTLKTAAKGATANSTADFAGTSERIIVNNFVQQGTGICGLVEVPQEVLTDHVAENTAVGGGEDDEDDIYGGIGVQPPIRGPRDTSWFFQNFSTISGAQQSPWVG